MATVVVDVAAERVALLEPQPWPPGGGPVSDDEILPLPSDRPPTPSASDDPPKPAALNPRLVSLDVFRGLTVALMILVDDAGGAFPSINHAPWTGVTLADFVMPFFLFGVGVSVALVFKKTSNKAAATNKVAVRTIKLFLLGLLLQGGYFHGRNHLTYGVDINRIRWLGVLQRIAIGYFLAGMTEIWFVNDMLVDSAFTFVKRYYIEWIMAILVSSVYVGLLYGLYVPNWEFQVPQGSTLYQDYDVQSKTVYCGMRGDLGPPCNAVGLIDRLLLNEKHLYQHPVYRRTKACSVNSPDYGPLPPDAPNWCLAPFDPEGTLSSLAAAVTCLIGLHFGHIVVHFKSHVKRMLFWSMASLMLLFGGYIMEILGLPVSKPLYTVSYMCVTAGVSGIVLTAIYYIVDVKQFRKPIMLLQWMGMNALIVYALAACELFPAAIQGFYWRSPENNIVDILESLLQAILHSRRWGTLVFVFLEIIFWCLVAGFLHMKGIYIKL